VIATAGHGWGLALFPLLSAAIALAFALVLAGRLAGRWRTHEAIWVIALAMYAAASVAAFLGVARGWSPNDFRVYWLFGALLNVPFLLVGEVYLLSRRRTVGHLILIALLLTSVFVGWQVWSATIHHGALMRTLPLGKRVFGDNTLTYRLAQYLSYPAYFLLLGGLVWSAQAMRGRPEMRHRTAGTLGIAIGATIVAVGSFAGAGLNIVPLFSVCLAIGIAAMFWGFVRASHPPRQTPRTEAVHPDPSRSPAPD
jgi:uncharacterized membrane-anchored protein YitT (DUF2179 family)